MNPVAYPMRALAQNVRLKCAGCGHRGGRREQSRGPAIRPPGRLESGSPLRRPRTPSPPRCSRACRSGAPAFLFACAASLSARAHLLGHPADGPQAPRQLHRRHPPVGGGSGPRRPGDLLHRRPARDQPRPTTPPSCATGLYDLLALLLAAGLDPERSVLFRQSDVQEHTELTWLLSSVTAVGELNRMHQFRDKSVAQRELVSAALLFYPVLQAADVLAYRAHEVPVGEDQREHLELMRDVARRFNARFGEDILVVPEHRIPRGRRADHGPPGAGQQDVDHRRHRGGHGPRPRRPRDDREEDQARGHRLRQRHRPRPRQARGDATSSTSSPSPAG